MRLLFLLLFFILNIGFLREYIFPPIILNDANTIEYDMSDKYEGERTGKTKTVRFQWKYVDRSMVTHSCNLTLLLLEDDITDALYYIEEVGNMSLEALGVDESIQDRNEDAFQWQLWNSVFKRIYFQAYDQFDGIVDAFGDVFKTKKLSKQNQLLFVLTFIQNIRYERPGGTFDLLPPVVTLERRFGDCDTKTLLAYVILEKMGIDCVFLWSYKYRHAMLGVAAGNTGDYKQYRGKRYYFFEATYPNWDLGELPPKTKKKSFWHVMDLDENKSGYSTLEFDTNEPKNNSTDEMTDAERRKLLMEEDTKTDAERRKEDLENKREKKSNDEGELTDAERRKLRRK